MTDRADRPLQTEPIDEQVQQLFERVAADDFGRFTEMESTGDCARRGSQAGGDHTETAANGIPMVVEHDAAETTVRGPDPLAFEQVQAIDADAGTETDD